MRTALLISLFIAGSMSSIGQKQAAIKMGQSSPTLFKLTLTDYENRVHAIWAGQIIATLLGLPAEHRVASVKWIDKLNPKYKNAPVDDDWYYEMVAIRGFEKYGADMTVEQLGEQWKTYSCGSWGSSNAARKLLLKGVVPPLTGHPYYNPYWHTIGPQFSADVYGALAPGMPNVAGSIARYLGHINGYAEGVDGAVFIAGMISLGFVEKDPETIIKKAAQLIHKKSPYRQCIDMVIELAEKGKTAGEVLKAVEDRWHTVYPATNNAVANGGIVATSLWFGSTDFLKTVNIAARSLDFTDSDCNAANAISVICAMKGLTCIPPDLLVVLGDRITGEKLGDVVLTPAVDESITSLSKRTTIVGLQIMKRHGVTMSGDALFIPFKDVKTQAAELFTPADFTKGWNKDWTLEGAGYSGPKGNTYLNPDSGILFTYPADEIRRLNLNRMLNISGQKTLSLQVAGEKDKVWELTIYIDDTKVLTRQIENRSDSSAWQAVTIDLTPYKDQTVKLRLYQNVLPLPGSTKIGSVALWKNLAIQ